jgi:hypothetical protein
MNRKEKDQETKIQVLERDGYRCVICFKTPVDVHEIIPRSALGRIRTNDLFDPKNRCCLCREHHSRAHSREARINLIRLMQELYNYNYFEEHYRRYLEDEKC